MRQHVNQITFTAWFHLRNFFRIRKFPTKSACATLVHAFVTSHLYLYNWLLYKFLSSLKNKLQRILTCAAKLIFHKKKSDSATPLLKKLYWLPIQQRIEFKILMIPYKCLNGQGAAYLFDLLTPYTLKHAFRSTGSFMPRTRLENYGDKTFEKAASKIWNDLPLDIHNSSSVSSFKKQLKTHLFRQAY